MKTFFTSCILAALFLSIQPAHSQTPAAHPLPDTSQYPYWIKMMQDPNENFFATQRAFNTYWKGRKITRGCG